MSSCGWIKCVFTIGFVVAPLAVMNGNQESNLLATHCALELEKVMLDKYGKPEGGDVGTQYRSGIYFYTPEQEIAARESMERHQQKLNRKIVTEILPAKKFYRAEEYHQQYLAKGGRFGFKQSAAKGCNDPIRCYG